MEKELSKFQLAAIGAIALAYNELEIAIEILQSAALGPSDAAESSISATEAKITSITKSLATIGLDTEDREQIIRALAAFRDFTTYRDVINHVRLMNLISGGYAESESKARSLPPFSEKALNIFYDHLIALEKEVSSAALLLQSISVHADVTLNSSEGKRACTAQFRGYGTRRQALPAMPWLPSEADLREVKIKWQNLQHAEMMDWLAAWPHGRRIDEAQSR